MSPTSLAVAPARVLGSTPERSFLRRPRVARVGGAGQAATSPSSSSSWPVVREASSRARECRWRRRRRSPGETAAREEPARVKWRRWGARPWGVGEEDEYSPGGGGGGGAGWG